jgi:RsiW-degrading membrane proteinase PrsW (M82 family)
MKRYKALTYIGVAIVVLFVLWYLVHIGIDNRAFFATKQPIGQMPVRLFQENLFCGVFFGAFSALQVYHVVYKNK